MAGRGQGEGPVEFSGAQVTGDLNLQAPRSGAACSARPSAASAPRSAAGRRWPRRGEGPGRFIGARVTGDLSLQDAEIGGDLSCGPEGGQRTEIGGGASLAGAKVRGQVAFIGARVKEDLALQDADIGSLFSGPEGGRAPRSAATHGWPGPR